MAEECAACPVAAGDMLAGKYRIERVLGVGGMGIVVAATHVQLDQRVAVKFLLPEALAVPEVVARFSREARVAARIRSEHVARVLDVGALDPGGPYIVMEYLEGRDLEAELTARGPLPVEQTVDWLLEACEALAEAHVAGIVHRDLKPANFYLATRADRRPTVKVLDFGISKLVAPLPGDTRLTRTQTLVGSPLYMAPEQLTHAQDVDVRIDVWALGVILYELLSGRPPFPGETMPEVVAGILRGVPEPLAAKRLDLPRGLESAIDRCLAKDPAERTPNVAVLARALAPFGSRAALQSVDRISRIVEGSRPPPAIAAEPESARHASPLRSHRTSGAAAVARTDITWNRTHGAVGDSVRVPRQPLWPLAVFGALAAATVATLALVARHAEVARAQGVEVARAQGVVVASPAPPSAPVPAPAVSARDVAVASPAHANSGPPKLAPAVLPRRPAPARLAPAPHTSAAAHPRPERAGDGDPEMELQ